MIGRYGFMSPYFARRLLQMSLVYGVSLNGPLDSFINLFSASMISFGSCYPSSSAIGPCIQILLFLKYC